MGTNRFLKIVALFAAIVFVSCAAITKHMQYSKETKIDKPPYYASFSTKSPASAQDIAILPVQLKKSADFFSTSLKPLQDAVNSFLKEKLSSAFQESLQIPTKEAPEVLFGDERYLSESDSDEKDETATEPRMLLITRQSSPNWRENWQKLGVKFPYAIIITLSYSGYQAKMKNWKGSKELRLGTNYIADLPWLTSLDDPIPVIQLTGALINSEGKIVRVGAEGICFKRGSFVQSLIGLGKIYSNDDIQKVVHGYRREDLPGKPLAWQVAAENLIKGLTSR
ncbi:MAG: hypothetical protein GXO74_06270 [Calditrichaeota bacterium]|nr:hypothetical protein [Calditrichota bacterium]